MACEVGGPFLRPSASGNLKLRGIQLLSETTQQSRSRPTVGPSMERHKTIGGVGVGEPRQTGTLDACFGGARIPGSGPTPAFTALRRRGSLELLPGQGLIDPSRSLEPVPSSVPQAAACFLVSDCKQI